MEEQYLMKGSQKYWKWDVPLHLKIKPEISKSSARIGNSFLTQPFIINKYHLPKFNKFQAGQIAQHIIQDCPKLKYTK